MQAQPLVPWSGPGSQGTMWSSGHSPMQAIIMKMLMKKAMMKLPNKMPHLTQPSIAHQNPVQPPHMMPFNLGNSR